MQNETQNQNIDSQEVKVEEAAVQNETPQEQNIGVNTDQYRGPDVEEPADIIDPKVTMSSEDLVGSDPKVTMNPEDIFGPETAQEPGFADDSSWGADDSWGGCGTFPSEDPFSWESGGSDVPDPAATTGIIMDPVPTDQVEASGSGADAPLFPEAVSMPHDKIVDPAGQAEPTPGGYDGSGIAGGLDLDGNGKFYQTENNPDLMSDNEEKEYSYDEEAYEDAEDAWEDLQDALQDGDEEDLAEALEELQDYLGGFDKGGAEEDQSGEWITGSNGDIWVDDSGKIWDSPEQAKAAAQLPQDGENDPHNHGDPEEVSNAVDKEPVDAPDASGAAVSGAAAGAGAAVGAGAVGEAGGLGEHIDEALGIEGAGKVLGDLANGDLDGAIDAATEQAGNAIDDALGIEGAGKVLDDLSEGDWGEAAEGALEAGLDYLGVEGADEILDGLSEGDLGAVAEGAFEAGLDYLGIDTGGEVVQDIVNGDWGELANDAVDLGLDAALGVFGIPNGSEIVDAVAGEVVDEVVEEVNEVVEDVGEALEDVGEAVGDFFESIW